MGRFKFVHAADLHLGSPVGGLAASPEQKTLLQDATFRAFEAIVNLCLRENVAFLLLAGDLYDTKDRSIRARLHLKEQLSRLDKAGISTFIVHGNHDPLTDAAGDSRLPPSVKVFGPEWEEVTLSVKGACYCRVQGMSYAQEKVTDDLSSFFHRTGSEYTVGLLHANVGASAGHANYAPCALSDLSSRGLDYWALGHVHTRAEYLLESGGVAVYPGNPQGRHVREVGERGCVLVEVDEAVCRRQFVAIDSVRWHRLTLDVSPYGSTDEIPDGARDILDEKLGATVDGHVFRLVLEGSTPLHRELASLETLRALEERLRDGWVSRRPFIVLDCLENETTPALDQETLLAAGGLPAEVVRESRRATEDSDSFQALWSLAELDKLEGALRRAGLPTLRSAMEADLRRAAHRALSLLVEDR